MTFSFTPAAAGNYSTTVSVSDNASGSPQSLLVTAVANAAPAPQANLYTSALTFANVTPDTASAPQTVELFNQGNKSLAISSIAITGANAASFIQTNNCPATLPAVSFCTVTITMQPTTPSATFSASLVFTDNSGNVTGSTQTVALSGSSTAAGPAPQLVILPAYVDFTGTPVGANPSKTVKLSNTGTRTLTLSQISNTDVNEYVVTNNCGSTLGAGSSCTITIIFLATAMGSYPDAITFTDNALGSPHTIPITGTAVEAVAFGLNNILFTNVTPNTSASEEATLTNNGNIPLVINSITLAPNAAPYFSETNTCGSSVGPGASCTFTFVFSPTAAAHGYASYMNISTNATPSLQTVTLSGTTTGYAAQNTLYVEPDAGVQWLYTLVNNATSTIEITNYQLTDSTLLADLINACNRGVRVRVLLGGSATGNNAAPYTALNNAGANCSAAIAGSQFPVFQESALIIDDRQIAVMTLDLTSSTYSKARDYAWVKNDPSDVAAAEAAFDLDYSNSTPSGYLPAPGNDLLWTPDTQDSLLGVISNAQYGVLIEAESITSPAIVNQLLHDCQGAAIDVFIILGPNYGSTPIDQFRTNCPGTVYLSSTVHGTLVLVDQLNPNVVSGIAFIGSMSLDDPMMNLYRNLGTFPSGNSNILTLTKTFYVDTGTATVYQ